MKEGERGKRESKRERRGKGSEKAKGAIEQRIKEAKRRQGRKRINEGEGRGRKGK